MRTSVPVHRRANDNTKLVPWDLADLPLTLVLCVLSVTALAVALAYFWPH